MWGGGGGGFYRLASAATIYTMKEEITLRLYENPTEAPACSVCGRYTPDGGAGWSLSQGETLPLSEKLGGRVFGVIESVADEVHTDDRGRTYKLAVAWIQD